MTKKNRRANGEGTIYQRKDGRWEGAAFVLASDGTYKRVRKYGKTREEVHGKLVEVLDRSRRGVPVSDRPWKLGEYLDYWLEHVASLRLRATTYAKYETMVRLYLKPGLGKQPLDRLRVARIQTFLNQQLNAGRSVGTVYAMKVTLSAALTRAMREELISINPARLVVLPSPQPSTVRPWTVDEARQFLKAAKPLPYYLPLTMLLIYGLRRGEVLGIGWENVDLDANTIRIAWQIQRIKGKLVRVPVKTEAGKRTLPLIPFVRDAIIEHAGLQADAKRKAGKTWQDWGLVFASRTGGPIEPTNLGRAFDRVIKDNGLRRIRLHDLRHTTGTMLKDLKVSPRDAKEILGHARISVTMEIYTHGDQDAHREAIERISGKLFGE
ncbi:tyrosine-type recombinase/integrase [Planobispora takensis]|uniref:Site-specific integrase n=1 Tax=Planobispora takensis TaxID=1367882 RepID=A0A8J3SYU0_9ACTN|nr:site-specific integrase [Planobispora takensis]GIH97993.1 site-specific integrase [Planobispora takensis]